MTSLTIFEGMAPHAIRLETREPQEIATALEPLGVRFERWRAAADLAGAADDATVLAAYRADIDRLMATGGYHSCDVMRLKPDHPERDVLRAKFLSEHIHEDDEVRFFVEGSGMFYLHGEDAVYALECMRDDLISVPAGTRHWFDMGPRPNFTAIRLFTTPDGWVAKFTGDPVSGAIPLYEGAA